MAPHIPSRLLYYLFPDPEKKDSYLTFNIYHSGPCLHLHSFIFSSIFHLLGIDMLFHLRCYCRSKKKKNRYAKHKWVNLVYV